MTDSNTALTMCGWVLSSKEPRKNSKIGGRYNVKGLEFPGVKNINFCGRPILSNKSPLSLLFKLPENSNLRHMMCLCEDHQYKYHDAFIRWYLSKEKKELRMKPKENVYDIKKKEDSIDISVQEDNKDEQGGSKTKFGKTMNIDNACDALSQIVIPSSVKLRKDRKMTKRLVDEVNKHVKISKQKET